MDSNNKISIVIGFGLLIFVGMFVADHFSIATNREVATLGPEPPTPPAIPASQLINGPLPSLETVEQIAIKSDRVYVVSQGDSLRSICSSKYGDAGLANAVAFWNGISSANSIEVGQQIELPTRKALISTPLNTPTQEYQETEIAPTPNPTPNFGTYTVKIGDTLSEIAQKVCGSARFTNKLITLNKKTLPNPDRLQVGMKLRYPLF
jgi:nucleoid-associated protein YgaU